MEHIQIVDEPHPDHKKRKLLQFEPLSQNVKEKIKTVDTSKIYLKKVWNHSNILKLTPHKDVICQHSLLTSAYFIPLVVLEKLHIKLLLFETLMAKPKPTFHQGRNTKIPWPLYHIRGDWVAIPRQFGVSVFGVPKRTIIQSGLDINLETHIPLFNETTSKEGPGRIDQKRAVNHMIDFLKLQENAQKFGCGMYVISTGLGKTMSAGYMIKLLGKKALFVVPNEIPLGTQAMSDFKKLFGDSVRIGIMKTKNKRNWDIEDKDIVVTTYKSVATIPYDLSSFGTIIVDEAHESVTSIYSQMYFRFHAPYVILLTATPERHGDHCGAYLEWLGGPIVWHEKLDIATNRWGGIDVLVYNIKHDTKPIKEIISKSGELVLEPMIRQIINHEVANEFVVNTILKGFYDKGDVTFVLGNRVEHMENIYDQCKNMNPGIIVGTPSTGKALTLKEKEEAKTKDIIIATASIINKGFNVPRASNMVFLGPDIATNQTFIEQCAGRPSRDYAKKSKPLMVFLRHCYKSKLQPGTDGVFARRVDNACKSLRKLSSQGYNFKTVDVTL